jgi:hypothetical protein
MDPIDMLEGIAAECKWLHTRPDDYSLMIERELTHGTYGMHVHNTEEEVMFTVLKPYVCPGYAELELLRLLQLINKSIRPGAFLYSKEIGKLTYSTSLDFSDERPLEAEMIERRVNSMLLVMDAAYYCFEAVAGQVPGEAVPDSTSSIICFNPGMPAEEAINLFNGGGVGHA